MLERLEYQAGHAQVWRDAICNWFMRRSGIPGRTRTASAIIRIAWKPRTNQLDGYEVTEITPWEAASGSRAVQLIEQASPVRCVSNIDGPPGSYDLHVQYFDEEDGVSRFKLFVADRLIDEWQADNRLPTPTTLPDAHSSMRRTSA